MANEADPNWLRIMANPDLVKRLMGQNVPGTPLDSGMGGRENLVELDPLLDQPEENYVEQKSGNETDFVDFVGKLFGVEEEETGQPERSIASEPVDEVPEKDKLFSTKPLQTMAEEPEEPADTSEQDLRMAMEQKDVGQLINSMGQAFDQINRGLSGASSKDDKDYWQAQQVITRNKYKDLVAHITGKTKRSADKLKLQTLERNNELEKDLYNRDSKMAKSIRNKLVSLGVPDLPNRMSIMDLRAIGFKDITKLMSTTADKMDPAYIRVGRDFKFKFQREFRNMVKESGVKRISTHYKTISDQFHKPDEERNGMDDKAAIIAMFKILDPNSAVLQSEADSLEQARSYLSRAYPGIGQKIMRGSVLDEDVLRSMMEVAGQKWESEMKVLQHDYDEIKGQFLEMYTDYKDDEQTRTVLGGGVFKLYEDSYLKDKKVTRGSNLFSLNNMDPTIREGISANNSVRRPASSNRSFKVKGQGNKRFRYGYNDANEYGIIEE